LISQRRCSRRRRRDPTGAYRLVEAGVVHAVADAPFDLIFAAFTFDNIPTDAEKAGSLAALRGLLAPGGRLMVVVSSPQIYAHEWASFSTRDFPENSRARDGDPVRIVMLDVPDRRPMEDVVCSDGRYRDPIRWVSETTIAPWCIYVLAAAGSTQIT
jgi:hypothetical protein